MNNRRVSDFGFRISDFRRAARCGGRWPPLFFRLSLACIFPLAALAQPSVLAAGQWVKLGVVQTGIYKLDAAELQRMGLDVGTLDPRRIRIYGNGGAMLPQPNATARPADLLENSIAVEGEADGRFDAADHVLFFAEGPHVLRHDSAARRLWHQTNLYSDTAYYFLTVAAAPGKRVVSKPPVPGTGTEIRTFDDYAFHERELVNILGSGRTWWGEKFDLQAEQTFSLALPGLVAGTPMRLSISAMGQSAAASQFVVRAGGQPAGSLPLSPVSTGVYDRKGTPAAADFTVTAGGSPLAVTLTYERTGGAGYLDWMGVQAERALELYGAQTLFRSFRSLDAPLLRYSVANVPPTGRVWDVTDRQHPAAHTLEAAGGRAAFQAEGGRWREFAVFDAGAALLRPVSVRPVANQNLHGMAVPELLIVTHPDFVAEARRLAAFRQAADGLRVGVATTGQVYNEFSSGRQDVAAIRDFVRHLHGRDNTLRYLLLFGDASFDYKDRLPGNTNFVPVYESYQSLHPIFSFSSDDFFGFLEAGEGQWAENGDGDHTLDVGVGRLPVKTPAEAAAVVDKLIGYAKTPDTFGEWRQMLTFVADDGDANTHQLDADRLAASLLARRKPYRTQKIFLDAYPQQSFANGQQSPGAVAALEQAVEKGSLLVNYTGHGSEIGWAQEQILTPDRILGWRNARRLPLFVTATCEFGRYDDPETVSGAELALLNPAGGAVGLLTTTRPVFSSSNYTVNVAFYESVFEPVDGQMPRLGDIMRHTKNNSLSGSINRNFTLLGDPSLQLAYARHLVVPTRLNGRPWAQTDTLRALSQATLEGEVRTAAGVPLPAYTGTVAVTVFDKPLTATTLGTESARMRFAEENSVLFRGRATVRNGRFVVRFVVPKNIQYALGEGRVVLYATPATPADGDAAGAAAVRVGGSLAAPPPDDTPPRVRLFLNDTTFASGGRTGPDPVLLAHLADDNGITLSRTGVGQALQAVLDDSVAIVLNDFYMADPDTYRHGKIRYSLQNLTPGRHTLALTAWDTRNQTGTAAVEFVVADEPFRLTDFGCRPNPTGGAAAFGFTHNRPGQDLAMEMTLYAANGQVVNTWRGEAAVAAGRLDMKEWELTWAGGGKLSPGIYFSRITVRCKAESAVAAHKVVVQ